jgi:NAD(P)-dependent dehydrogenase (short-subunit alcohol dehydrogenase family)
MNTNTNGNSEQGKVVLVTGAGSGLGEAIAHAFGAAGWTVACVDVNEGCLEGVTRTLSAQGGSCGGFRCDVSDAEAVFETVRQVVDRFGRIDVVVNNAAVDHTVSIGEMSVEQWDQVIGVNLRGPFLFAKAALPHMERQRGGHIVNIASTAATRAWANAAAYHASKWGLVGFGRGLSVEGRPHNIRVTTVYPGGMRTHFFDRFEAQGIPMPDMDKLQDPANVAQVILYAVTMPAGSAMQEVMVTPLGETSWP